jgi:hypothetical protein
MKELTLPVSRLTRALLLHRYGAEPIRLDANDIRKKELFHVGTANRHLERKQYSLNTTVRLALNKHEYDHAVGKATEIGFYFYGRDKVRIFQFVWSRVTAGLPALHAIYEFYQLHGIEEDDFAVETAERLWKRWRAEKEKDRMYSTPHFVPQNTSVLLSSKQVQEIAQRVSLFLKSGSINMDPRYRKAILCWIWYRLTPATQEDVSEIVGIDQRNFTRTIRRFESYLRYNEDLKAHLGYVIKTTQARPTPSAAS